MATFDLSDEDYDDIDLNSFGAELQRMSRQRASGTVSWDGAAGHELFRFELDGKGAKVKFTELGKRFFEVTSDAIGNVDALAFANYCGLPIDSKADLAKRCGKSDVSLDDVIELARRESNFLVIPNGSVKRQGKSPVVTERDIFWEVDRTTKLEQLATLSTFREGATRACSQIYRERAGKIVPCVVKFPRPNVSQAVKSSESRMLAFEHAALTAMRRNGLHAAESEFCRSATGEGYLITRRVDSGSEYDRTQVGHALRVSPGATKMLATASWANTVRHGKAQSLDVTQTSEFLHSKGGRDSRISKVIVARHLFNLLIGNIDAHGGNAGIVKSVVNGQVREGLAPAFDVTPFLLDPDNHHEIGQFPLSGLKLKDVRLEDVVSRDAFSRSCFRNDPELTKEAFNLAIATRAEMQKIVAIEMVQTGKMSSADANILQEFINATPGSEGARSPSAVPSGLAVSGTSRIAKDRFAAKVSAQLQVPQKSAGLH